MTITQNELLVLYTQSQDKYKQYSGLDNSSAWYYKGRMEMVSYMLRTLYPGWERVGTVGYYVYHENQSLDAAIGSMERYRLTADNC
jgi:hypothetical protein